jgi:hypothetical protein
MLYIDTFMCWGAATNPRIFGAKSELIMVIGRTLLAAGASYTCLTERDPRGEYRSRMRMKDAA